MHPTPTAVSPVLGRGDSYTTVKFWRTTVHYDRAGFRTEIQFIYLSVLQVGQNGRLETAKVAKYQFDFIKVSDIIVIPR